MMKKYELTDDTITVEGRTLHRIKALKSFRTWKRENLVDTWKKIISIKAEMHGYTEMQG